MQTARTTQPLLRPRIEIGARGRPDRVGPDRVGPGRPRRLAAIAALAALAALAVTACRANPLPTDKPLDRMQMVRLWTLGEDAHARKPGGATLGLVVAGPNGEDPRLLSSCDARLQDALPTGDSRDEYYFLIDGRLHVGVGHPRATPARIEVEPGELELLALSAASRTHEAKTLLVFARRGGVEGMWELQVRGTIAVGKPAPERPRYSDFDLFRSLYHLDRCDGVGQTCLVPTSSDGRTRVEVAVRGPGTPRDPIFELRDCPVATRAFWAMPVDPKDQSDPRETGREVYLIADCTCASVPQAEDVTEDGTGPASDFPTKSEPASDGPTKSEP